VVVGRGMLDGRWVELVYRCAWVAGVRKRMHGGDRDRSSEEEGISSLDDWVKRWTRKLLVITDCLGCSGDGARTDGSVEPGALKSKQGRGGSVT
jgi:hypothetical protein